MSSPIKFSLLLVGVVALAGCPDGCKIHCQPITDGTKDQRPASLWIELQTARIDAEHKNCVFDSSTDMEVTWQGRLKGIGTGTSQTAFEESRRYNNVKAASDDCSYKVATTVGDLHPGTWDVSVAAVGRVPMFCSVEVHAGAQTHLIFDEDKGCVQH
jgi:hypothetical protein